MANRPTGLLLDTPPAWTIFDVMRPLTDLPDIDAEEHWVQGGVTLHYQTAVGKRRPHPTAFEKTIDDAAALAIADPASWTDTGMVATDTNGEDLYNFQTEIFQQASPTLTAVFRTFSAEVPLQILEMMQQEEGAQAQALTLLRAVLADQMSNELVDSLNTKNPGLALSSTDVSNAAAVNPVVAVSALYDQHFDNGGNGDCVLHIQKHALGFYERTEQVGWEDGKLIDIQRNPVHLLVNKQNRLTDLADLESAAAQVEGEGTTWLSPPIYGGHAATPMLPGLPTGPRGMYQEPANEEVGVAQVPALVCFKPVSYGCDTVINLSIGA